MNTNDYINDRLLREAVRRSTERRPQPQLPADFAERVMARIKQEGSPLPASPKGEGHSAKRRRLWLYSAAAGVAALVVGGVLLLQRPEAPMMAQQGGTDTEQQTEYIAELCDRTDYGVAKAEEAIGKLMACLDKGAECVDKVNNNILNIQ